MTKYKNQEIIHCKDINDIQAGSTKLTFGRNKDRALKMCESDLVKGTPHVLTKFGNRYYLWF